ncbi:hypothetical protein GCM10023311_15820 [Flaviramulus aquimarinus]|uniref:Lipocalin-like domain-containing protein n=1 Tax=Flaviramulus aquimarinus TaxID=1170456 RepID=A0ABP9F2A1_9FLAO
MKRTGLVLIVILSLISCSNNDKKAANKLVGTWDMVYAEMIENDSLKIKDLTNTRFIKIINHSHFSFFNQENNSPKSYYSGAGTYTLNGNSYMETLNFAAVSAIKNHTFPFTIAFKGDTLIQSGIEEVKQAGIKRKIIEKYIRIN